MARAWAEETESVGVNGLGNAVSFEGTTEVAEMRPSGVGGNKAPCNIEPGVVIDSEQENLLGRGRPPLVDGAVMLP